MTIYQISGPSKRCCVTDRAIGAGEKFYAALFDEAGQFVRKDYADNAWQGKPENAIAWWMGRIPANGKPQTPKINDELLIDCFVHLATTQELPKQHFRYVVGLLLMRRRRLRFEDATKNANQPEVLVLRDAKTGERYELLDPHLSEEQMNQVQDEVFRVLGWE